MKYRLLMGSHGRREGGKRVRYNPGDILTLTRDERRDLGSRVVPYVREDEEAMEPKEDIVVQEQVEPESEDDDSEDSEDWGGIVELVAADVIEIIESADKASDVQAILDIELSNRGRKTVVSAAEDRLSELTDTED